MSETQMFAGLTPAQRTLVSYWRELSERGHLPSRQDFDPGYMREYLKDISIVEIDTSRQVKFRISGSGIRIVLGQDMTGRYLHELDGAAADMLSLGMDAVVAKHAPVGGLIERTRDYHAWLRLPLMGQNGVYQVLCHDALHDRAGLTSTDEDNVHVLSSGYATVAA